MQLLIDITDEMYQAVKNEMWFGGELWYKALKNGKPIKTGQKLYTPEEVWNIIIEHGQHDSRFKLGEIIKYSPAEVMEILKATDNEEADNETGENRKAGWKIAHGMMNDRFWCSCGFIKLLDSSMMDWKYCPKCGAIRKE